MIWRWQPPALSPVSPRSLVSGLAAASGLMATDEESVIKTLCERYEAADALLTDSGTSALVLALLAVVPSGGTVAYPGYACIDLTAAAVRAGVQVRLYDLDPETLSPDIDSIRNVISRGVDAIVVAHLYGYPADVDAVRDLAGLHGIPVIEDSAQGAGGTLKGTRLGALSDIAILSFGRGKGTTAGSGGAVLVRTPLLAEWARKTRVQLGGASRGGRQMVNLAAQWMLSHPLLYRLPASIPSIHLGEMVYHLAHDPHAIPAAAAAVLPTALKMDDREVACRRVNAMHMLAQMNGSSRLRPVRSVPGGESGYLRLACLDPIGDLTPRPSLGALRGYPLTVEQHEELRPNLAPGERAGHGSALLRDRLFTIPTHSRVGRADLARLTDWVMAAGSRPAAQVSFS